MSDLMNLDNTALKLLVVELREKLAKTNAIPCNWCRGTSETIDSLIYQVEQFELERNEMRVSVKKLASYLQVEAI